MATMTKFEQELMAMEERSKRQENIVKLDAMIAECEELLAVIPGTQVASFEEQQDRNFLLSRRTWLYEMRSDEQRAFDDAGADPAAAEIIVSKLN